MKKKFLISTLMLIVVTSLFYSQVFATNNMMDSAKNAVNNAGDAIGEASKRTKDTIVNGTQNLANDTATLGNQAMNGLNNATNDTMNDDNTVLGTTDDTNYDATRTATGNTGLFGMSDTATTWVILGIVGAVIVGLIWYYSSQYEHKNYNND